MPSCARFVSTALLGALCLAGLASAQSPATDSPTMRERIELLTADLYDLARRYDVPMSGERAARLRERLEQEQQALATVDFATLGRDDRIDWLLLDNHLKAELSHLADRAAQDDAVRAHLPFVAPIVALCEARRRMEPVDPERAGAEVAALAAQAARVQSDLRDGAFARLEPPLVLRAADRTGKMRRELREWFEFRDGYDPLFSWWVRAPFHAADEALDRVEKQLREDLASRSGDSSLVGDPIGEQALARELAFEWIPYSPAELVAIAEREFAWCDREFAAAAQAMGCGDDWRQALEKTKQRHRAPGEQPQMIRDLALEAIAFVEAHDLVTVPPLAKECWRMSMMSPAAQRVNPFFLGGETIQVSFPTDAMSQDEKLQSLRSNNEHFCRATVFHELIPGHWLQQYSQARYRTYRARFDTPFWIEGWALYWEMRLYDLGLPKTPEDRVGMLYWRKHRCARIVFSLNFHLGRWTGPQCVDYLIERVGHERSAAEGEVRRSVQGGYGPLYQAAYMLGGLQLRALHDELVRPGSRWTERSFHDEVLRQGSIPMAVLRAALADEPPAKTLAPWRFASDR